MLTLLLMTVATRSWSADRIGIDQPRLPDIKPGTPVELLKLEPNFYLPPQMPYILNPGEQVIPVELESGTGAEATSELAEERKLVPKAVFVVKVKGVITVTDTPLTIDRQTCLIFTKGAKIVAAPDGKAKELILIKDTELVCVSAEKDGEVVLDGAGRDMAGVRIHGSGKVHLDRLVIQNCKEAGVSITGTDADRYAHPTTLTRSRISGSRHGIMVRRSAQFIVLDTIVAKNGTGMDIDSASTIVANTICAGNDTGLLIRSKDAAITRNQLIANTVGLNLSESSDYTLVYENTIQDNELGASVDGKQATLGWNIFRSNREPVKTGGSGHVFQCNVGIQAKDLDKGAEYFNPPTIANPHTEKVIWKAENSAAMGRHDITIQTGGKAMTGKELTQILNEARAKKQGDVLVAHLKGEFVIESDDAIKVPDHTCILLEGSVKNQASNKERPYMMALKGEGCASLSGGSFSTKTAVFSAITTKKGKSTALIDGVDIDLHAPDKNRGTKSTNAVSAKQHKGVFFMRGCTIKNPGHRGVWMHAGMRMFTLANRFYAGGMIIDFDAFCFHSAALFNTVSEGTYHSSILFEEAVKNNTAFANICRQGNDESCGIAFHNQDVKGNTEHNTSACNHLENNAVRKAGTKSGGRGSLNFSSRTMENATVHNLSFNDRVVHNKGHRPIYFGPNNAKENYVAQMVLIDSPEAARHMESPSKNTLFTHPEE